MLVIHYITSLEKYKIKKSNMDDLFFHSPFEKLKNMRPIVVRFFTRI